MQKLGPPDTFYVSAAIGWLELGDPVEADRELCGVSAECVEHPDVLEVRWAIFAQTQRWPAALVTARALLERAPNRSSAWLHHAYALRRAPEGGLQRAWEALLPAYEKFPGDATIAYNLSCYACQMQQFNSARTWLRRAFKAGNRDAIKQMALKDPDLEPLWREIRDL